MKNSQRMIAWISPVVLSAAFACSHQTTPQTPVGVTPPPPALSQAASEPASPYAEQTMAKHDPARVLLRGADELSSTTEAQLTGAQASTVHSLDERLQASNDALGATFGRLRAALAAQVRAGAFDSARVQADEDVATDALQAHLKEETDVLNALHATLTPTQRAAVVTAARAQQPGSAETQGGEWASATATDTAEARLDRLTRELDLDPTQQQQVATILAAQPSPDLSKRTQRQARVDWLLSAFQNDNFDATTAIQATAPAPAAMVHEHVQRKVSFLTQLLPILQPAQRDKLASKIEASGASHEGIHD